MLDINFIRKNKNQVKKACQDKKIEVDLDKLLNIDERRREHIKLIEDKKRELNEATKTVEQEKDNKKRLELLGCYICNGCYISCNRFKGETLIGGFSILDLSVIMLYLSFNIGIICLWRKKRLNLLLY